MRVDGMTDLLVEAECCRTWLVNPLARIGKCGLCGKRPVIKDDNGETLTRGERQ